LTFASYFPTFLNHRIPTPSLAAAVAAVAVIALRRPRKP
jgi:hypothetical protein